MRKILPLIDLIQTYQPKYIKGDLTAGFTTGMLLIPQGMAYAVLAGLPVQYGLYASLIIPIIYMFFGTSTRLVVGPAALDSILLASGMSALTVVSTEDYIEKVMLIVFVAGIIQIIAGVLKFGFIANFFSQPLLKSFVTAAAILIGFSQLKYLFQIKIEKSSLFHESLNSLISQYSDYQWKPLLIGVLAIAFIRILGKFNGKKIATPLALVIGIVFSYFFNFSEQGIDVVGDIPKGLPEFQMLNFSALSFGELIPIATIIGLMGFTLSSSITKSVEDDPDKVRPNQEFIALGISNMIGPFFGAYQADSSFSRTAINKSAGANTRMSNIISSLLILSVLLFFTPVFYYLPKSVLGAVIIAAMPSLISFDYFKKVFAISKNEFIVMILTFITTVEFGIVIGLSIGVAASIFAFLYSTIKPHIAKLGQIQGTNIYRNTERFETIQTVKNVMILRVDSPLYFTNIKTVLDLVEKKRLELSAKKLILECSSIYQLDITGVESLGAWLLKLKEKNIEVYLSNVIGPVRDTIHQADLVKQLGGQQLFISIESTINYIEKNQHPDETDRKIANQKN